MMIRLYRKQGNLWRVWEGELQGDHVTVRTGFEGSELSSVTRKFEGSSVGKKNEKTAEFNAKLWFDTKVENQVKRKGYARDKADITTSGKGKEVFLLPMLAKECPKGAKRAKLGDEVFMQPKLDGVRGQVNIRTGEVRSRQAKPLQMYRIRDAAIKLGSVFVSREWIDGEFYCHGMLFRDIVSIVKSHEDDGEMSEKKKKIQFHVYDIYDAGIPFRERTKVIEQMSVFWDHSVFTRVDTIKIKTADIDDVHSDFEGRQYEGIMIRPDVDTGYEAGKRSATVLKVKSHMTEEFEIVGGKMERGDIHKEDRLGAFICVTDKGKRFEARPMGEVAMKIEYWKNLKDYVGRWASVKFKEWTPDQKPREPVMIGFRLEDREA